MNGKASTALESAGAPDFRDHVALIADGCDHIGTGIARHLASMGAIVGLCGPNREALESLAGEIVAQGGQAIAAATEGAGPEAISGVVDRVHSEFGKIDILVNNTSEAPGRSLAELSIGDFKKNVDTMLMPPFAFLREVVPCMRARKYGRIINIYGLSYLGLPAQANLAAAHAGIFGLTRSVALETAADGITVNSLVKGDIATANLSATDAEKLANRIPVKRLGTAADIVHAIDFFASASTTYVTGQTLFVCGGKSAYFSMSV